MNEIAIEDLMKPRYKVIADYPWNAYPVGLVFEGETLNPLTKSVIEVNKYPHLFRKLEWWQDRRPEEMPEYYKLPGNGKILKTSFRVEKNSGVVMLDFKPTETVPTALMYTLPATETDYLNYINSKP